jgi:ADP-ribosylglycohydrolase
MIGAIAGDIIGSVYEGAGPQAKDFPLFGPRSTFTDDTVLTIAVGSAILRETDYRTAIRQWGRRYPRAGYGGWFIGWLYEKGAGPYNSYGNGSAMRVSAVGWAFDTMGDVLREAAKSAGVTHNHPEGIKGAMATAAAVFLGRSGEPKDGISSMLTGKFGYDCSTELSVLQSRGGFDVTCQGTVPAAAVAFLESSTFEDAVRNAVSFGGDADTLACIAGSMAEAFYGGVPEAIQREVVRRLDEALLAEVRAISSAFGIPLASIPGEGDMPGSASPAR